MATLRQKTAFGPGVYRGYNLHAEKLRKFAEGTNKAIAAGVPIPLLKRHAPINADDSTTLGAAQLEGAGWVTKVHVEPDGALSFEAKDVPDDVAQAVNAKTARFTSPEFREHYTCEKAGVYEGPIIRHFAFTPTPGNPHQGEIQTMALSEAEQVQMGLGMPVRPVMQRARPMCSVAPELGCFQLTEDDREDGSYKASGDYPKATEDAADNPDHKTPKDLGSGMEGESIEDETLADDEEWGEDENGKKVKRKKAKATEGDKPADSSTDTDQQFNEDEDPNGHELLKAHGYVHQAGRGYRYEHPSGHVFTHTAGGWTHDTPEGFSISPSQSNKDSRYKQMKQHLEKIHGGTSQHGEKDEDGFNKPANDEPPAPDAIADTEAPPESPPVNPDMPPVATDKSKLTAVLAGLAQKGIILPSDYDFVNPGALDIILAALNSSLKAEQDAEAEAAQEVETEDPPVQDASMPFSELNYTSVLAKHGYKTMIASKKKPEEGFDTSGGGKVFGHDDGHVVELHQPHKGSPMWMHWNADGAGPTHGKSGASHTSLDQHLSKFHSKESSQHTEVQFSEAELAAMPAKARAVIEAGQKALLAERKAKVEAERKALQFAERERVARNNAAREAARTAISKAKIPPAVRLRLLEDLTDNGVVQFSEGTEKATYTATQVAALLEGVIPKHLQFNEEEVAEAEAPKVRVQVGVDAQGKPVFSPYTSQQFFEQGDGMPSNHVDAARAEELVASNPAIPQFNRPFTVASHVARENGKHPNNVMRN